MKRHSKTFPRRSRRGSYLALTMIIALAMTSVGATFISLTTTAARTSEADFTERNLVYVAETGIDQALSTLQRYLAKSTADGQTWIHPQPAEALREWTGPAGTTFGAGGWTRTGDGFRKDFGSFTLGNGRPARLRVLVRHVPEPNQMSAIPDIVAEVSHTANGKTGYSRQFAVRMRPSTRYQNSLIGRNSVVFGDNLSVDSYNSGNGVPALTNLGDKAVVATLSAKDGAIRGANPSVYGYLATGGDNPADNLGAKTHIFGPGSQPPHAGYTGQGIDTNRVTRDFSGDFPVAPTPATEGLLNLNLLLQSLPIVNGLVVLPAGSYRLSNPLNLPKTVTQVTETVTTVTENVTTTVTETVTQMLPLGILGALIPVTKTITRDVVTPVTRRVVNSVTNELSVTTISTLGNVTIVVDGDADADPATVPPISLAGNSKLLIPFNSSLKIYTPGHVNIAGDGILNGVLGLLSTTGLPKNFMVYGTNTNTADGRRQSISISGKGNFSGVIDAPNADVTLNTGAGTAPPIVDLAGLNLGVSGATNGGVLVSVGTSILDVSLSIFGANTGMYGFQGAIIGYNVTTTGPFAFHYDESLGVLMYPSFTMDTWVELRSGNRVDLAAYGF